MYGFSIIFNQTYWLHTKHGGRSKTFKKNYYKLVTLQWFFFLLIYTI